MLNTILTFTQENELEVNTKHFFCEALKKYIPTTAQKPIFAS